MVVSPSCFNTSAGCSGRTAATNVRRTGSIHEMKPNKITKMGLKMDARAICPKTTVPHEMYCVSEFRPSEKIYEKRGMIAKRRTKK
jgi:hypothetical protein